MKWLKEFTIPVLTLLVAAIDINLENSFLINLFQKGFFRESTIQVSIKLIALMFLLCSLWYIHQRRKLKIQEWLDCFTYAGLAKGFDQEKHLYQNRRVDIRYVELKRSLNKFISISINNNDLSNNSISSDAVEYMRELRFNYFKSKNQQQQGVLLEGGPYIGKTRMLCELIKRSPDDSFLLIPTSETIDLTISKEVQTYLQHRPVEILLDDLERFEGNANKIAQLVHQLQKIECQTFLWSTVRNGGPAAKVHGSGSFRELRERFEHLVLDPPSVQAMQQVAISANENISTNSEEHEHSFSFVEHRQFGVMKDRWNCDLKEKEFEKNIMRCAAALDSRGISLDLRRWKGLAEMLCDLNITKDWPSAWSQLNQYNFLTYGVPDPGYLKFVVDTSFQDKDDEILTILINLKDAEGIHHWCLNKVDIKASIQDCDFIIDNLKQVLVWVEETELVLKASMLMSLGWVYSHRGEPEKAKLFIKRAIECALNDKTSAGWCKAAQFSGFLGIILQNQYKKATEVYRSEVESGRLEEISEGRVRVLEIPHNLGFMLQGQKWYEEAVKAYREGIEFSQLAEKSDGWVYAAAISLNLGGFLDVETPYEDTVWAYRYGIEYGQKADNAEGFVESAKNAQNLGFIFYSQKRYKEAEKICRDGVEYACRAETLEGRTLATTISFCLGFLLEEQKQYTKAKLAYEEAVNYGKCAETADAREYADKASSRLEILKKI